LGPSLWEEAKKKGDDALKRMINNGLYNTSVTAVLIGAETADRKWVQYEIQRSAARGNGLLGIYIHSIKDRNGQTDMKGDNPFSRFETDRPEGKVNLAKIIPVYDWVQHDGYEALGDWIEEAGTI